MPVAHNMDELKRMIAQEMKSAIDETQQKVFRDMKKETAEFYTQGTPNLYHRTGQIRTSPRVSAVSFNGTTAEFKAWLEPGNYDNANRDLFLNRGYASYYDGREVLQAAESHSSGILGKGGFWSRSLKDIKKDLSESMKAKGFR